VLVLVLVLALPLAIPLVLVLVPVLLLALKLLPLLSRTHNFGSFSRHTLVSGSQVLVNQIQAQSKLLEQKCPTLGTQPVHPHPPLRPPGRTLQPSKHLAVKMAANLARQVEKSRQLAVKMAPNLARQMTVRDLHVREHAWLRRVAYVAAAPAPPVFLQAGPQAGRLRQGHLLKGSDFLGIGTCQGQPPYGQLPRSHDRSPAR